MISSVLLSFGFKCLLVSNIYNTWGDFSMLLSLSGERERVWECLCPIRWFFFPDWTINYLQGNLLIKSTRNAKAWNGATGHGKVNPSVLLFTKCGCINNILFDRPLWGVIQNVTNTYDGPSLCPEAIYLTISYVKLTSYVMLLLNKMKCPYIASQVLLK